METKPTLAYIADLHRNMLQGVECIRRLKVCLHRVFPQPKMDMTLDYVSTNENHLREPIRKGIINHLALFLLFSHFSLPFYRVDSSNGYRVDDFRCSFHRQYIFFLVPKKRLMLLYNFQVRSLCAQIIYAYVFFLLFVCLVFKFISV